MEILPFLYEVIVVTLFLLPVYFGFIRRDDDDDKEGDEDEI